ncbi:hypothetical protein ACFWHL_10625 [Streptomyces massasporeus]
MLAATSLQCATESSGGGHTGPTWRYDYTAATPADAGTTTVTDPEGDETRYAHNADGEVTKVTDPLNHSRHAKYTNRDYLSASFAGDRGESSAGRLPTDRAARPRKRHRWCRGRPRSRVGPRAGAGGRAGRAVGCEAGGHSQDRVVRAVHRNRHRHRHPENARAPRST